MTRNQLMLTELLIKKNKNEADIRLAQQTLAETIANNLRNHRVNVSKNEIQRLANNQLDNRERQKLAETIRSNLMQELEKNRHNLKDEEIRTMTNTINSLKNKYELGPIIAALLGLMPEGDAKKLYGGKLPTINDITNYFKSIDNKSDPFNFVPGFVNPKDLGPDFSKEQTKARQAYAHNDKVSDQLESDIKDYINKVSGFNGTKKVGRKRKEDENEIPTDFSSSVGPSNISPQNVIIADTKGPGPGENVGHANFNVSEHGTTSGGTDYQLSGGHRSTGIIYA